ncbi:hypothetical protein BLOT_009181 [Blomia tropicalis]|nr:hypothetical protein BLOT_009181 [Blomia tropicalis]
MKSEPLTSNRHHFGDGTWYYRYHVKKEAEIAARCGGQLEASLGAIVKQQQQQQAGWLAFS